MEEEALETACLEACASGAEMRKGKEREGRRGGKREEARRMGRGGAKRTWRGTVAQPPASTPNRAR